MIYGYIRVSTDKQTCENQKLEIKKYCKIHRMRNIKFIAETISGTKKVEKRRRIGYDENGRFIGEMIENSIRHVLCQCCDVEHGFEYQAVQK